MPTGGNIALRQRYSIFRKNEVLFFARLSHYFSVKSHSARRIGAPYIVRFHHSILRPLFQDGTPYFVHFMCFCGSFSSNSQRIFSTPPNAAQKKPPFPGRLHSCASYSLADAREDDGLW
jgi:hypothetical protein